MNKFLRDLRSQPLISSVTVIGTALSIFLIMVVVMLHNVNVTPFAPESNRDRLLHGQYVHLRGIGEYEGNESSMSTSLSYLKELYGDMPGIDEVSFVASDRRRSDVQVTGGRPYAVDVALVDDAFFRIFNLNVLSGKPFDHAASEAGLKEAVITESVARALFGAVDVAGREMLIAGTPYNVAAVVADVSKLAGNAYSQVYVPYNVTNLASVTWGNEHTPEGGPFRAYLLRSKGVGVQQVKDETARRIEALSSRKKSTDSYEIIYHEQPYTQEEYIIPHGSNSTPDVAGERKQRYASYLILLLIPAINLSVITQSRLRRRVSEIGVRRAFGCTRARVIADIITENFSVTLLGGVIGFILSVVFAWLYCSVSMPVSFGISSTGSMVTAGMLINWSTLGLALLFCFVLNLLSAGIPAWRASRVSPVEALGGLTR